MGGVFRKPAKEVDGEVEVKPEIKKEKQSENPLYINPLKAMLMIQVKNRFPTQIIIPSYRENPDELLWVPEHGRANPNRPFPPTVSEKIYALILNSPYSIMEALIPRLLNQSDSPQIFFNQLCVALMALRNNWARVCVFIASTRATRTSSISTSILPLVPMIIKFIGLPMQEGSQAVTLIFHFAQHRILFSLEQDYWRTFFRHFNLENPSCQRPMASLIVNKGKPSEKKLLNFESRVDFLNKCLNELRFLNTSHLTSAEKNAIQASYIRLILKLGATPTCQEIISKHITSFEINKKYPSQIEYNMLQAELSLPYQIAQRKICIFLAARKAANNMGFPFSRLGLLFLRANCNDLNCEVPHDHYFFHRMFSFLGNLEDEANNGSEDDMDIYSLIPGK